MEYILIHCAMQKEADNLLTYLENYIEEDIYDFKLYRGSINNVPVILAISRIGVVNASSLISLVISKYNIKYILNYGLIGGYGKMQVGDILAVTECLPNNSYVTNKTGENEGISLNNLNLVSFVENEQEKLVSYKTDDFMLDITKKIDMPVTYGILGSGDAWNREYDKINYLNEKYNVLGEDMECIAVYQIANKVNIPVLSIKIVSNNENRNLKYNPLVIDNLISYVVEYVNRLSYNLGNTNKLGRVLNG